MNPRSVQEVLFDEDNDIRRFYNLASWKPKQKEYANIDHEFL